MWTRALSRVSRPGAAATGTYEVYVVPFAGEPARWPTVATITIRTNVGTPAEDYRVFTRTFTEPGAAVGRNVATVTFPGGVITESDGRARSAMRPRVWW